MKSKVIATKAANRAYLQQFVDAVTKVKDDDDDDDEEDGGDLKKEEDKPTPVDWFFHIISVPWKVLFACVPPPHYLGGWCTFFGALSVIGVITALVGDMANLVGCCMGLDAEITAITFVALGTSLPDTFASKKAAEMDPYADNSIGNITGSNSVNVFIGLGLSWSVAALYWETNPVNDMWREKFSSYGEDVKQKIADHMGKSIEDAITSDKAVFMVPSGSLWFNLLVFSLNAFFALQHLAARRAKWGGELGGPKRGIFGQYFSAAFLTGQWFVYVIASSIFVLAQDEKVPGVSC
jgi:solute carrier family 8 (sodium/calcium exchanger)